MAELIIFSGKLKGRRLILPDQRDVIVGRDEDCQMRIASSLVSRKHCVLRLNSRKESWFAIWKVKTVRTSTLNT